MGVIWYRLRADVRVRWRTLALIAVLVGIGGGVALTAFAGARRTAAAVPQMLAYSRPDDGGVLFDGATCLPPKVTGPAARSLAPLPSAARVLQPQWPLTCHDSHVAQQMVERAAELAGDSHSRTRHAAVLVEEGSCWPGAPTDCRSGEDHCYCRSGNWATMTSAGTTCLLAPPVPP